MLHNMYINVHVHIYMGYTTTLIHILQYLIHVYKWIKKEKTHAFRWSKQTTALRLPAVLGEVHQVAQGKGRSHGFVDGERHLEEALVVHPWAKQWSSMVYGG